MDNAQRKYLIIYLFSALLIFSFTYYITDRIHLRAKQLAENKMDVEYRERGWKYATGITGAYSLIYLFFARDMLRDRERFKSED